MFTIFAGDGSLLLLPLLFFVPLPLPPLVVEEVEESPENKKAGKQPTNNLWQTFVNKFIEINNFSLGKFEFDDWDDEEPLVKLTNNILKFSNHKIDILDKRTFVNYEDLIWIEDSNIFEISQVKNYFLMLSVDR